MVREVIFKDYCTPCLRDSEGANKVEAVWLGTISFNGEPPRQLDLCEDHREQYIAGLPEALEAYGDKVTPSVAVSNSNGRHYCPFPGCDASYEHRTSLTGHVRKVHGTTLGELEGKKPQFYICDLCSFQATNPQGLGAHKRAMHDIKGNSPSTLYVDSRKAAQ